MEYWYVWLIVVTVSFAVGFYVGVVALFNVWLKPGLDKGILDFGNSTYRMSRIVKRNTRI